MQRAARPFPPLATSAALWHVARVSRRARLLLALLLAVLGAAIALIATTGVRLRGREVAAGGTRGGAVVQVAPDEVIALAAGSGGRSARLERRAGGWAGAGPGGAAVDAAAVAELLDAAVALGRRATLGAAGEQGGTFDAYGLTAPRAWIELGLAGGGTARVELGDGTGADGAAFVRAPDGRVVVVAADAAARLEAAIGRLLAPGEAPPPPPAPPDGGGPAPLPFRG